MYSNIFTASPPKSAFSGFLREPEQSKFSYRDELEIQNSHQYERLYNRVLNVDFDHLAEKLKDNEKLALKTIKKRKLGRKSSLLSSKSLKDIFTTTFKRANKPRSSQKSKTKRSSKSKKVSKKSTVSKKKYNLNQKVMQAKKLMKENTSSDERSQRNIPTDGQSVDHSLASFNSA